MRTALWLTYLRVCVWGLHGRRVCLDPWHCGKADPLQRAGPFPREQTNTCENITFPILRMRAVIIGWQTTLWLAPLLGKSWIDLSPF